MFLQLEFHIPYETELLNLVFFNVPSTAPPCLTPQTLRQVFLFHICRRGNRKAVLLGNWGTEPSAQSCLTGKPALITPFPFFLSFNELPCLLGPHIHKYTTIQQF